MTLNITTETNQYCLRVPAHRYSQGKRCVYYFPLDLQFLDGLLPQRVDEGMIRGANRRLTPSHAKDIQDYLREEDEWLLGGMMLGISPQAVEFESYKDASGRPNPNFGELRILAHLRNTMRIFDGQHRRRAIGDLLMELSNEEENFAAKREVIHKAAVPIALYAEDNLQALRQMFADASKTKRIEASTVTRFDRREAFNQAAMHVAQNSKLFRGRIEMESTAVGMSGSSLLAINQLASNLKAIEVGIRGRVSKERNEEYMQGLDGLYQRCLEWSDEFLPAAREEYEGLVNGEIASDEIPAIRRTSLAFSATFIRILAGCYRDWCGRGFKDWKPLAQFVRTAALKPRGEQGSLLVDAGAMALGDSSPIARRQEVQSAVNYIVTMAMPKANGQPSLESKG